jgi:hypothetical protein
MVAIRPQNNSVSKVMAILGTNIDLGGIVLHERFGGDTLSSMSLARDMRRTRPELPIFLRRDAIADVAESYPKVCDHELEMFTLVLPDCTVERINWMNQGEHNCGYLIKKREI